MPNPNLLYPGAHQESGPYVFTGPVTFTGTVTAPNTSGTTSIGGANAAYALSPLGPADIGLKAWSFPNYLALGTASAVTVAGSVYLSAVHLTGGVTYSNLYLKLQANGGAASAGSNFAGLYNSSGALVATTADLSGALGTTAAAGTTGYITCPLSTAYTVPGAGGLYWVGVEFNFGFTGSFPTFYTMSNFVTLATSAGKTATGIAAPNGTQPYPFSAVATTSGTALPSSFTLTNAGTTGAYVFWAGAA